MLQSRTPYETTNTTRLATRNKRLLTLSVEASWAIRLRSSTTPTMPTITGDRMKAHQ